jgi:hypothetical protein
MAKNIIQKAILDLHYTGSADGFAVQREIGEWCSVELGKGLEEILDKADPGTTVRKIDRIELEIDLGSRQDWLTQLKKEITIQLQQKLSALVVEEDSGVEEQTVSHHFFEVFIYFLQKGCLPWWSSIRNRKEFSISLLSAIKNGISNNMKSHLLEMVSETVASERLIDQLNDQEWIQFIAEFYTGQKSEIQVLFKDVLTILNVLPELARRDVKATFKKRMWEHAGDTNLKKALQDAALQFAKEVFMLSDENGRTTFKMIQPVSVIMDKAMENVEKEAATIVQPTGKKTTDQSTEESKTNNKKQEKRETEKAPLTEGIYIGNAGLVIVSPFLPTFFKKLKLADEDKILNEELAVNLVAHLATGAEYHAEFELVFPKILCGIEPTTPISTMVAFTEKQKNEAKELLLSAIEYWNVLRDTSPTGLRESFLQRDGKLSFKDKEWILEVEPKPFDMLLQNLPWNISMIKLPWMERILKTEWGL